MTRILTITSGKGGVGKTNLSLNLALCLSKMGHKTCLFDADLGLANINILLGLHPEHNLKDILFHGHALADIMVRIEDGLEILPGTSGVEGMANLGPEKVDTLIRSFSCMALYDFILIDTSAGISRNVISFCLASSEVIVVVTPEPTSMIDAFALLKVLYHNGFAGAVRVVVNQCKTTGIGKQTFSRFRSAVAEHLGKEVLALGIILEDEKVVEAVKIQRPLQSTFPGSAAAKSIQKIAERMGASEGESIDPMDMEGFWSRFIQAVRGPLKLPRKAKEKRPETASPLSESKAPESDPKDRGDLYPTPIPETINQEQTGSEQKTASPELSSDTILPVLEGVAESISSVSREIQLIRQMIAGYGEALFYRDEVPKGIRDKVSSQPIRLDLDAFLRRIQDDKKES